MHDAAVAVAAAATEIERYRAEQPGSPQIRIVPDRVRADGDWLLVLVDADDRPERDAVYYDHLHAIERRLEKQGHKILLVPTLMAF